MAALKITYKDPHQLKSRARNPRTHSAKQIKQIAASIKEFGFISPILIDGYPAYERQLPECQQRSSGAGLLMHVRIWRMGIGQRDWE